ncbi:carboxypeptidase-like regulatory domain-containing protein [Neobacillus cucumis]|uniref:Carboxypeptidase regulatory-like domain-containing protein n=1 Tax=Neobacillus cucumis TaxID=1740721 RepID=A0A2N5HTQ0_9BACI|nr:carboxypeptidase-like regulatory domain-containing protein [Neobacillus cucumis]PLS08899.1 hypothetical protein CVD27_02380 [Neobacillus cucumis]
MGKKVVKLLLLLVLIMSGTGTISNAKAATVKNNPLKTVSGTIKEDGKSVKNSLVLIQDKDNSKWIHTLTDGKGEFKSKLSDGTYSVKAFKGKNSPWFSVNEKFIVKKGKIKGLKEGEIDLSKKEKSKKPSTQSSNFNGVLKEGSKGLKANLIISKYDKEEIYTVSSIGNGSFSASLSDGNYYLFGIEEDGGFYRYTFEFTVENGKVLVEGVEQSNLFISIPTNAYSGKVADSISGLAGAEIVLEKSLSDDEYDTEYIQSTTTSKQGTFSLRALSDGTYSISVYHETYYSWNSVTFTIQNGIAYVNGVKTSSFQIKVPDLNVKGTVTDGKAPIGNSYITFEGQIAEGEYIGFSTPVDSKGNYQYRLPDGNYTVYSIDEQNRNTTVNIPFEIQDGKLLQNGVVVTNLKIVLPPVTFNGKIVDSGVPLQGAINIEKNLEDGNMEWYSAVTDENGLYSLRLTDGNYRVTGGYLFEEGQDVGLSAEFNIINSKLYVNGEERSILELQIPPVSVNGLVTEGDHALTSGSISVTSEDQSFYSWKNLNPDGTFTLRLADGNYKVMDVYLEDGTSASINQSFSIVDGKTYVNGELQEVLKISVPPVTVKGFLTQSGNPVIGYLYIMETNNAENPLEAWAYTNEEGKFQLRLPDGSYKVYEVYLNDGTTVSSDMEFKVESGQLYVNNEPAEGIQIEMPVTTIE